MEFSRIKKTDKKLNFLGFQELNKAAVYEDNYKNRKLGRVGRPYDKSEVRKGDKEEYKKELKSFLNKKEKDFKSKLGADGLAMIEDNPEAWEKIQKNWVKEFKESKKGKNKLSKTEKRVDVSKVEDEKFISISKKSEIIRTATNEQIDSFIDKMGFDIDKSKPLSDKKHKLVREIMDYAELEGSHKEIGESIDEILEEGMEGGFEGKEVNNEKIKNKINKYSELHNKFVEKFKTYEDKIKNGNLTKREEKEFASLKDKDDIIVTRINTYKVLDETKTLKSLDGKQIDKIIDYSEFNIDKSLPLEEKQVLLLDNYRKSAKLGKPIDRNLSRIADNIDEIIEDALMEVK